MTGMVAGKSTVLMVEQYVRTAPKFSNRVRVPETEHLVLDRPASTLLDDPNRNRLFPGGAARHGGTAGVAPPAWRAAALFCRIPASRQGQSRGARNAIMHPIRNPT